MEEPTLIVILFHIQRGTRGREREREREREAERKRGIYF
jgi:hypothetical protein